jgi:FMN phosphatase YigB (HAD superfamily)
VCVAVQRLAFFDLDNTLIDRLDAFRRWAAEFGAEQGLGERDVSWMIELDADGSLPMDQFFGEVRFRFGLAESVDDLWSRYRRRLPFLVVCRSEVIEGLGRLRDAGWLVGIVTNGMPDNQRGKILESGLADVVNGWAISEVEGFAKPDPRLFEIAARRCGADLSAGGWMVGDVQSTDIAGGQAVGLRTIWIDRGVSPALDLRADHVVNDVVQGIGILLGG